MIPTMPHSDEAERQLLAIVMNDPRSYAEIIQAGITAETFYSPRHELIFKAIEDLFAKNEPVDLITVTQRLRDKGDLEKAGGAAYSTEVASGGVFGVDRIWTQRTVLEKAHRRQIIANCQNLIKQAYEAPEMEDVLLAAQQGLFEATQMDTGKEKPKSMKDLVFEAIDDFEAAATAKGITGISTGIEDLDDATGGMFEGEFIVIAGKSSGGKSALAVNILEHVSIEEKRATALFGLEMSNLESVKRILTSRARVNHHLIRKGVVTEDMLDRLARTMQSVAEAKMILEDQADMTIEFIRARSRAIKAAHRDLAVIVVDYLQLVGTRSRGGNRELEVATVSRNMKQMAKELNVVVIGLSQLNEEGKTRESRAITQDANNLWTIVDTDEGGKVIVIAKARSGERGIKVPVIFKKEFTRFTSAKIHA